MDYQKELICVRCGKKGTIRKVKLHSIYMLNDEHIYFCCIGCKSYGPMFESLTTNAEEFPLFLDEEWEWAEESLLLEKSDAEHTFDLTKEGKELEKEKERLHKALAKDERKHAKK